LFNWDTGERRRSAVKATPVPCSPGMLGRVGEVMLKLLLYFVYLGYWGE